jgi:hypothetical protein
MLCISLKVLLHSALPLSTEELRLKKPLGVTPRSLQGSYILAEL